ncbi:MAG: glycosyltransferase family 2 protein [Thermoguttaceae bacterium]|jgi:glycosyltransferase involved in cell wall biosynthesis
MNPSVTVVIPCFNAAPFLRATLESTLNQSHAPFEVLVIDDGSTDESAAIAESYGPPVRVISQTNQGESVARNRGIEEAKGNWIAFLDSDDIWLPEKLERQLAVAEPDVACIHSNFLPFGANHHVRDVSKISAAKRYSLERLFLGRSPIRPSTIMVPKSLPVRFPTWTRFAEDTIYFVDVCQLGKVVLVKEFLTAVRYHSASQSAGPGVVAQWHQTFEEWLRRNQDRLDRDRLRSLRRQMLDRLVHQTFKAYYKQQGREFGLLRNYLAQYAGDPAVQPLLEGRIPPYWFYSLYRGLGKLRGLWQELWMGGKSAGSSPSMS